MATARLLRTSKPIQFPSSATTTTSSFVKCVRCQSRATLVGDNKNAAGGKGEIRKPVVAVKASTTVTDHITTTSSQPPPVVILSNLAAFISIIRNALLLLLRDIVLKRRPRSKLNPQMLIERAIIDCRFFTLLAVAGALLGSVLCFIEGCVLVVESYAHYFHALSQRVDQGHLVHLLIEAIDMFLVGTALLVFGVGLYLMFVKSRTVTKGRKQSNLLGLFYMKSSPPGWVGMESIGEAKSRIGHAVMMILQVGLLDKFKDIPLITGLDLACFAAAVLTSSASIFVLSRLHRY